MANDKSAAAGLRSVFIGRLSQEELFMGQHEGKGLKIKWQNHGPIGALRFA
jgi:hypothetical protein